METHDITLVAAARPNLMKTAPLERALKAIQPDLSIRKIYTGCENDPALEPSLWDDLSTRPCDACLGISEKSSLQILSQVLKAMDKELSLHPCQMLVTVDESTASVAAAIAAKKRGAHLVHLCAGVRSEDLSMSLEVNRELIDAISDTFFASSFQGYQNLLRQGKDPSRVHYVGNILLDNIRILREKAARPSCIKDGSRFILLTLNRRDLLEKEGFRDGLMKALDALPDDVSAVMPAHGYVKERLDGLACGKLILTDPLPYPQMLWAMSEAIGTVTDSCNVADECTFLSTPTILLGNWSEHPELLTQGSARLANEDPERLKALLDQVIQGGWEAGGLPQWWDGRSAERIARILLGKS